MAEAALEELVRAIAKVKRDDHRPKAPRSVASRPHAVVRVKVGLRVVGIWRLPREQVTIGRASGAGVHLPSERAPRILARIVPYSATPNLLVQAEGPRQGWLLINGERTRARAANRRATVEAEPSGVVALQEGTTRITWPELDEAVTLTIVVGARAADPALPVARDRTPDEGGFEMLGTVMALERNDVQPGLRHTMAVLFRHLLKKTPKPVNVYKTAAQELGTTQAAVKRSAERLMGRINQHRFGGATIDTFDQLGHYLVTTAALITTDDLQGDPGG